MTATPHQLVRATQTMRVHADDAKNPELASRLAGLRGSMYANLPPVPSHYAISPSPDGPRVVLHDLRDGRAAAEVSLCDARGFINALVWRELVGAGSIADTGLVADQPRVRLCHVASGEYTDVGLCDLRGFRQALHWLHICMVEDRH